MPTLPDPTASSGVTSNTPASLSTPLRASAKDIRSPLRIFLPILGVVGVLLIGFLVTKFLILPRFHKQEPVVLTWWGLWEPESVVAPVIAKFESEHPDITISYRMESLTDYRERLQAALTRGEGPDIMRVHATWLPMLGSEVAPASPEQFSVDEFKDQFYSVAATDLVRNNAVVGVPLMTDGLAMFVNNDIFSATSSAVPTNWDDFRKVAFRLTKRDETGRITQAGAAMGTATNVMHWSDILAVLMLQNSVDLAKPDAAIDAKGRNLGADALKFYTIFATEDRVWDESLPPDLVAFGNGTVAMMFAPSWQIFEILRINRQLNFSVHPIPQLTQARPVTWAHYWAEAVSRRSKHQDAAWTFLKFLSSSEALQIMYTEATKIRTFGEPYPRPDMAGLLEDSPYVKAFITQAPSAVSWYMSSRTGDNGINDEITTYYQDAVNSIVRQRADAQAAITTVAQGVHQVLVKYGVVAAPAPTGKR